MRNNADIIAELLKKVGVRYVFGYPGGQNARFIEALYANGVEFILVSHEASASFMADVVGRLTGKPGVCLSTLGPGATNMTTGVGNAFLDRVPMLAFTAKMGRVWRGRTVQMQVDHQQLYKPITKWTTELETGSIYATLKKAIEIAMAERPGPVHIDFPEDVAEEMSEPQAQFEPSIPPLRHFDPKAFKKAQALICQAKYPLVAIGLSMNRAQATAELREFIEKHRLPAVSTLMAKGHIPNEDSGFVGVLGRARRDIVAEYYKPADLIIAIGYDPVEFNYEEWVRKDLPIIHIDTVRADIGQGYSVPCQIIGDIRQILRKLLQFPKLTHHWDLEGLRRHRRKLFKALTPPQTNFSPHQALLAMREILPKEGILVSDVGAHTHLIGQLWDPQGPGNLLVSNGWSSMGFGIPAAIAAKLLLPDRPVLACVGDGGFLMKVGEIHTAVRLKIPVVIVVFRDHCLSLIRVKQKRKEYHCYGVDILDSHYAVGNPLLGAKVIGVNGEEEFREALEKGLRANEPVVIDTILDGTEYDQIL
jgi:acetolactate synthase-1/2/3 large subunit